MNSSLVDWNSARNDREVDSQCQQAAESTPSIIVAIPDQTSAAPIRKSLMARGYTVHMARSANDVEHLVARFSPVLVLLDLRLSDVDGLIVLINLREKQSIPVIVCSNTRRSSDAIVSLKLGAEDFIALPCDPYLFQTRIDTILRRILRPESSHQPGNGKLRLNDLIIDTHDHRVVIGDEILTLTPTEFRLLVALMRHPNRVINREEIAQQIWGQADGSLSRSIDVHIRRIRAKLETHAANCPEIISVRGFGYKIVESHSYSTGIDANDDSYNFRLLETG